MKEIALLGTTASGKTALSIELAKKYNAIILSLDSLSIYKEIDIASAKPTPDERGDIPHYGIDEIRVDEQFSAALFIKLYQKALEQAKKEQKHLIIVGGTSFYLKSIIEGLSPKPNISKRIKEQILHIDTKEAYALISDKDKQYAQKISPNDRYRIEKWLEIYLSTSQTATDYFKKHKKNPQATSEIKIFEIETEKELLKKRIQTRTKTMLKNGLIDEVFYLEKKYTRKPKPMQAIGIKETLEYLDGYINKEELLTKIVNNTAKLAKRQRTFNKTQFDSIKKAPVDKLKKLIEAYLQNS